MNKRKHRLFTDLVYQLSTNCWEYPCAWLCGQHVRSTSSNGVMVTISWSRTYRDLFVNLIGTKRSGAIHWSIYTLSAKPRLTHVRNLLRSRALGLTAWVDVSHFRPKRAEKLYSSFPTGCRLLSVQIISSLVLYLFTSLRDKIRQTFSLSKLRNPPPPSLPS